ncbi:SMC-Scp complex subunit ScpB [Candidatus Woesearchaeota archaeon]|nr:SMC-Scp complex subunit ScpB [Candidatus Woesearchaeota archaeon]
MNEKNRIEALLFTVAKRIHIDEIAKITGLRDIDKINRALNELRAEYEAKGSSMVLHDEGEGYWKLTVKDHYMPMVQKVVSQMELDRPLMETLAVIAWKYPVLQADVVKIRHNKAYDHLKQLDELGFITRMRFGRTNKITLTQKFFEYFDLPSKEQAKEVFKNVVPEKVREKVEKTEKEIDEAERKMEELKNRKKEMEKKAEDVQKPPMPDPTQSPEPKPDKPLAPPPEAEIKKELKELQKEEDKELEEIEEDAEELDKEEKKEFYD